MSWAIGDIVLELTKRLEDLDLADDIGILAHTTEDIQMNTTNFNRVAKTVGLKSNANRSTIMRIKARD